MMCDEDQAVEVTDPTEAEPAALAETTVAIRIVEPIPTAREGFDWDLSITGISILVALVAVGLAYQSNRIAGKADARAEKADNRAEKAEHNAHRKNVAQVAGEIRGKATILRSMTGPLMAEVSQLNTDGWLDDDATENFFSRFQHLRDTVQSFCEAVEFTSSEAMDDADLALLTSFLGSCDEAITGADMFAEQFRKRANDSKMRKAHGKSV
ncbi:MAG: hypothetical protein ACJAYC_002736 [Halieaceae bacterium]|jgi:hypothetical protein